MVEGRLKFWHLAARTLHPDQMGTKLCYSVRGLSVHAGCIERRLCSDLGSIAIRQRVEELWG